MRPRIQRIPHGCAAVGCMLMVSPVQFMCAEHIALIPETNREELLRTFADWKAGRGTHRLYIAARIRAIVAVAALQKRDAAHSLHAILEKIDSGEWVFHA